MSTHFQVPWRELGLILSTGIVTTLAFRSIYGGIKERKQATTETLLPPKAVTPSLQAISPSQSSPPTSPPPSKPQSSTTFRVRGIMRTYDQVKAVNLLKDILELDGELNGLRIRSLAADAADITTNVATIDFKYLPRKLLSESKSKPSNKWIFKLPDIYESEDTGIGEQYLIIDTHFLELTTFSSPPAKKHKLDIIAVAGLSAHPFHSFRSQTEDYMWLRDTLPSDVPGARVMTYGYDSQLLNTESFQDLDALGRGLCRSLHAIQTEKKTLIPKLFIGHSLGGLVIKQSMILMKNWDNEDSDSLYQTYGIIFLGVPSHGMRIEHLLSMVEGQPNQSFIHSLSTESQLLSDQCHAFKKAFNFEDSEIACFYETCLSPTTQKVGDKWTRDGPSAILVNKFSAQQGRDWETGSKVIPINKNHSMIARFNRNDEDYSHMKTCVQQMARNAAQVNITRRPSIHHAKFLREIHSWLSPPDPRSNHDRARKLKKSGTGTWFTGGQAFANWKRISGSPLWLYGKPGCGKTILSASIIEEIINHLQSQRKASFAYFYFDFNDIRKQTMDGLIRSLLYQLFTSQPQLVDILVQGSSVTDLTDSQPSIERLVELLDFFASQSDTIYISIDALDECTEQRELLQWLTNFAATHARNIHLIVTSRREDLIAQYLNSKLRSIPIQTSDVDIDINHYVSEMVKKDPELCRYPRKLRNKISTTLSEKSDGMFRWAVCQIEALKDCDSFWDVEETLGSLPATVDDTYERALWKIPQRFREQSFQLFQWIIYAEQPLTLSEAAEILITSSSEHGQVETKKRLFNDEDVLKYCGTLATIRRTPWHNEHTSFELILAHYSVQEYLVSDRVRAPSPITTIHSMQAHATILGTFIQYLHYVSIQKDVNSWNALVKKNLDSWNTLVENYPLIGYIKKFPSHLRQIPAENSMSQLFWRAVDILQSSKCSKIFEHFEAMEQKEHLNWYSAPSKSMWFLGSSSPIIQASHWGVVELVKLLLDSGVDVDTCDQNGPCFTALQAAALSRDEGIINLLLDRGANIDAQGGKYGTALQAAAREEAEDVVMLLLDRGADINAHGGFHGTALQAAARYGSKDLVKLLLDRGADVNFQGGFHGTALQAAARNGDIDMVKLLLDHGADVNSENGLYKTCLQAAAYINSLAVVKLLLNCGANVNAQGGQYGTALQAASTEFGHKDILGLLLDRGADVNAQGGQYGTALQALAVGGDVKLLLDRGADVNIQGGEYGTALRAAASNGYIHAINLLLDHGADINAGGEEYGTALQAAARYGSEDMVKLLLDRGADVNAQGGFYGNALQAAARLEFMPEDMVKLLLNHGADVNAQGGHYGTALKAALLRGDREVVNLLKEAGALSVGESEDGESEDGESGDSEDEYSKDEDSRREDSGSEDSESEDSESEDSESEDSESEDSEGKGDEYEDSEDEDGKSGVSKDKGN